MGHRDQDHPEHQKDKERKLLALGFTEFLDPGPYRLGPGSEKEAGAEGGDEAVAADLVGQGVGDQGQGDGGQALKNRFHPAAPHGLLDHPAARQADSHPGDRSEGELLDAEPDPVTGAQLGPNLGHERRDAGHDGREGDAVIESAFHSDRVPDFFRNLVAGDDGLAERGIGR